ncbi:MAG: DUF4340 domain-containing protein [Gammaproteobacteria bacterium]|nr:DUF4340 domain-containing protein [Gammaproteobacteria bacterium]
MNNRSLLNLGLLALVTILVLLVIVEPGKEPAVENQAITNLESAQINRIRIERSQASILEFKRRDSRWWITSPLEIPANEYRMERLLGIVEARSQNNYPASGQSLELFGLQTPTVHLFLNDTAIAFGKTEPLNHLRYLQVGDTIHLMRDGAYYHLIGDYTTFVSTRLLEPSIKLTALQLPGLTLELEQGRWHIEPKPKNYSADSVVALIDAWRHAHAIEVKAYSGDGRGEKISLTLSKQEETVKFEIIQAAPDLVLGRSDLGIEYHLSESTAETLLALKNIDPDNDSSIESE